MSDSTRVEYYMEDSATSDVRGGRFSPAKWRPSTLLGAIIAWVVVAEITDVFILHNIPFSSSLVEGVFDCLVLSSFIFPIYFLLYRPLRDHWQRELKAQQEVRSLNHKLLLASEDERRKLALELHDHFGQMVTTLQCKAERIQRQFASGDTEQSCQSLMDTVSQMGEDIRRFTSNLRPDMLDDLGLVDTLKWYTSDLAQQHQPLQIEYSCVGVKERLPANIEIALYRVCQEALNNIIKHANASQASVTLAYSHPIIIMTIRDNGDGLPSPEKLSSFNEVGLGLLGMRERLAAVGGSLELSSQPGEKTTVRALVPIKVEAESKWL